MAQQTYQTYCPLFPGFYGSTFEYDNEEDDINSYNEEHGTDLNFDDFTWDYKEYHVRVAKAFVNKLELELRDYLPVKFEFEELISPKYYNFSNDSINVTVEVNLDDLLALIKERGEEAAEYFKAKYTSRSGFISHHSNDLADWLDKEYILEKPNHRIGALLSCLATIEIDKDRIIYWAEGENWCDYSPKEKID